MAVPLTPDPLSVDDPAAAGGDAGPRIGRPRDEAREAAILDAVLELLATVGYDRMSMDAVATAARASKATIYRRWPGKVDLVVAALRRSSLSPADEVEPAGSLRADLLAYVRLVRRHIEGHDGGLIRGVAAAAATDPELADALREEFGSRKVEAVARIVQRAVAAGELPAGASGEVAAEVVPAVLFMRCCQNLGLDGTYEAHVVDAIALPLLLGSTGPASGPD